MEKKPDFLLAALRSIAGAVHSDGSSVHYHPNHEAQKQALDTIANDPESARSWLPLHAVLTHALYRGADKGNVHEKPPKPLRLEALSLYRNFLWKGRLARAVLFHQACRSPENRDRVQKAFIDRWLPDNQEYSGLWESTRTKRHSLLYLAQQFKAPRKSLIHPDPSNVLLLSACRRLPAIAPVDVRPSYALEYLRLAQEHPGLMEEAVIFAARIVTWAEENSQHKRSLNGDAARWANALRQELTENWDIYGETIAKVVRGESNEFTPFEFFQVNPRGYRSSLTNIVASLGGALAPAEVTRLMDGHWNDDGNEEQIRFRSALAKYPERLTVEQQAIVAADMIFQVAPIIKPNASGDAGIKVDSAQYYFARSRWSEFPDEARSAALKRVLGQDYFCQMQEARLRKIEAAGYHLTGIISPKEYWEAFDALTSTGEAATWWVLENASHFRKEGFQDWLDAVGARHLVRSHGVELAQAIHGHGMRASGALQSEEVAKALLRLGYYRDDAGEVNRIAKYFSASDLEMSRRIWDSPWRGAMMRHGHVFRGHPHAALLLEGVSDKEVLEFCGSSETSQAYLALFAAQKLEDSSCKDAILRARKLVELQSDWILLIMGKVGQELQPYLAREWPFAALRLLTVGRLREIILANSPQHFSVQDYLALFRGNEEFTDRMRGKLLATLPSHDGKEDLAWAAWAQALGFAGQEPFQNRLLTLLTRTPEIGRYLAA